MKVELLTIRVEDLVRKPIDIFNEVYNWLNEDQTALDMLYDEYVKYTREYSTGSCYFSDKFKKSLPVTDKIMHYISIDYDSLVLQQEDKYITLYINLNINIELFKSM